MVHEAGSVVLLWNVLEAPSGRLRTRSMRVEAAVNDLGFRPTIDRRFAIDSKMHAQVLSELGHLANESRTPAIRSVHQERR